MIILLNWKKESLCEIFKRVIFVLFLTMFILKSACVEKIRINSSIHEQFHNLCQKLNSYIG